MDDHEEPAQTPDMAARMRDRVPRGPTPERVKTEVVVPVDGDARKTSKIRVSKRTTPMPVPPGPPDIPWWRRLAALGMLRRSLEKEIVVLHAPEFPQVPGWVARVSDFFHRIFSLSIEEVVAYRALAALYRAGVPLLRSLEILGKQMESPRLRKALNGAARHVSTGRPLSSAMALYPGVFPDLHLKMVAVGESSGNMDLMLERLAEHVEKTFQSIQKVRAALTYPCIIFAICIVLLLAAPSVTFNGIFTLLRDFKVDPPLPTRILMFVSTLLSSPWAMVVIPLLVVLLVTTLRRMWAQPSTRAKLQRLAVRLPGIGPAVMSSEISRFSRTLATLYTAGVPILEALRMCGESTQFIPMREAVAKAKDMVADGERIQDALCKVGFFPPMLLHLMAAGEETGQLPKMLDRCAAICEEDVDRALQAAERLLEPLVLLVVGSIVGFVVVATMLPMVQVIQTLN